MTLPLRTDIVGAAQTTVPSLWSWNGDEGVEKRERGPGCSDLALPSLDVAPRRGDHPQPDETEGQADEIDPKAAAKEHANEPQQGRVRGGTDPDEEQCSVMTGKGLRRSRREGPPSDPGNPGERGDPDHDDRPRDPRLVSAVPGSDEAQRDEEEEQGDEEGEEHAPKDNQPVPLLAPRSDVHHLADDRDRVPPEPSEGRPPTWVFMVRHVIMLRPELSQAGSVRAIVFSACLPNLRPDKFVGLDRTVTFVTKRHPRGAANFRPRALVPRASGKDATPNSCIGRRASKKVTPRTFGDSEIDPGWVWLAGTTQAEIPDRSPNPGEKVPTHPYAFGLRGGTS